MDATQNEGTMISLDDMTYIAKHTAYPTCDWAARWVELGYLPADLTEAARGVLDAMARGEGLTTYTVRPADDIAEWTAANWGW
ncbi:MAG: hypothetical protein CMK74_01050 [Pseudomonadales bacterium]|jgi:hypothetical protein|nr:hypothetical protein [Pseudomonadales bacterium]|tara:strand:- start:57 stop:305 length:249 start_codon:yes stop_codon:yes gene_type:complete